jgi:diguanylate cyclase (GGDEF)-like protein
MSIPAVLPAAARPKLLVVDDDPVNIQVLYRAFAEDHQVLMATTGQQALEMCLTKQPDLILLDVMMPDVDGYEVCRRLKEDPATREIPVIFVTAHNDSAAEAQGLDLGAADFISKPIHPRIVRARVRTQLTVKAHVDLLRHLAFVDGLTGIHNRRRFDDQLATEWARAARAGTPLSVLLIDVDFFKKFNDHYGHQAGDDCLRRVATAMRGALKRPADLIARYGGEEFACILPDTDLNGALTLAEQLGQAVQAETIAHAASSAAPMVTVSLGAATKPPGRQGSAAELLRLADEQLYRAKEQGRNRACGALLQPEPDFKPS